MATMPNIAANQPEIYRRNYNPGFNDPTFQTDLPVSPQQAILQSLSAVIADADNENAYKELKSQTGSYPSASECVRLLKQVRQEERIRPIDHDVLIEELRETRTDRRFSPEGREQRIKESIAAAESRFAKLDGEVEKLMSKARDMIAQVYRTPGSMTPADRTAHFTEAAYISQLLMERAKVFELHPSYLEQLMNESERTENTAIARALVDVWPLLQSEARLQNIKEPTRGGELFRALADLSPRLAVISNLSQPFPVQVSIRLNDFYALTAELVNAVRAKTALEMAATKRNVDYWTGARDVPAVASINSSDIRTTYFPVGAKEPVAVGSQSLSQIMTDRRNGRPQTAPVVPLAGS